MGNVIAKYAFFPPTPPTYDQSLDGLFFISHKNEAIPAVLHTLPDSEETMYAHRNLSFSSLFQPRLASLLLQQPRLLAAF